MQQRLPPSDGRLSGGSLKPENRPPPQHCRTGWQHLGAVLQHEEPEFPKNRKPAWAWVLDNANAATAAQTIAVFRITSLPGLSKPANPDSRFARTKCFAATRNANTTSRGFRLAEPPPVNGAAWLLKIPFLTVKLTAQTKMTKVSAGLAKSTVQRDSTVWLATSDSRWTRQELSPALELLTSGHEHAGPAAPILEPSRLRRTLPCQLELQA